MFTKAWLDILSDYEPALPRFHFTILCTTLYVYFLYAWVGAVYTCVCVINPQEVVPATPTFNVSTTVMHLFVNVHYVAKTDLLGQGFRMFVFCWVYVSSFLHKLVNRSILSVKSDNCNGALTSQ